MIIQFLMGDRSYDGHGRTSVHHYESNMTKQEIEAAYAAGVQKLILEHGPWIEKALKELCKPFEDNTISVRLRESLRKSGLVLGYDACEGYLEVESFVDIYIQIAKLGRPDLSLLHMRLEEIFIGGYGLV